VPEVDEHGMKMRSVSTGTNFGDYDAVVVVTDHSDVDYARMRREAQIIVDTRDVFRAIPPSPDDRATLVRL
jgi:UDP-N-acetyl-D-glucosamine dehydrogenase